jgi:hypothetical protein
MAEHPYYEQDFANIDFRKYPERYQVGKGEQGVLLVEPYKSEILPYWRFKTPEIAQLSADSIYNLFLQYKRDHDFVGMDMAKTLHINVFGRSQRQRSHHQV